MIIKKPFYGKMLIIAASACLFMVFCLFNLRGLASADNFSVILLSALFSAMLLCFIYILLLLDKNMSVGYLLLLILLSCAALYLRMSFFDFRSHDYESFLVPWVEKFRVYGPIAGFKQDFSDYNMPYLYILSVISLIPCSDLYLIKIVSVMFDLVLAAAVYLCVAVHTESKPARTLGIILALFVPTVWLNSSMWGQCDSLYVSLLLMAYYAVWKDKPVLSFILSGLAFSFKLQTVFFLPVYLIFWMIKRVKFKHFFFVPITYAVSIVPALIFGKPLGDIIGVYFQQVGEYSHRLNLNSPSVFGFVPEDANVNLFFWLGIAAAFLFVCAVLLYAWKRRGRLTKNELLILTYLFCAGIPFLLPSMHDRYFYLADQLSVILILVLPKLLPVAPLTVLASYSAYYAYLYRKWLFGAGMAFPALLLLLAICAAAFALRSKYVTDKQIML